MELPKGTITRKQMIAFLRNEGNVMLLDENKIRPKQRAIKKYVKSDDSDVQEFMPCHYCKGIYRLKSLRKHTRKCSFNASNQKKHNVASLRQNLLIFKSARKSFLDKLRLKDEV